jgi:hypothetical protein
MNDREERRIYRQSKETGVLPLLKLLLATVLSRAKKDKHKCLAGMIMTSST